MPEAPPMFVNTERITLRMETILTWDQTDWDPTERWGRPITKVERRISDCSSEVIPCLSSLPQNRNETSIDWILRGRKKN
jgi:hypothetical protein